MIFDSQTATSDFELVRKEFYRLWFFAHKASQSAREAQRLGKEEDARGAQTAFRMLSRQAKEACNLMDSMREARPEAAELNDIAIEQDLHFIAPEIFMAEAEGGTVIFREGPPEDDDELPTT